MKKIALIILILFLGGFLLVKINYFQKSKQSFLPTKQQGSGGEESKVSADNEPVTVDSILEDVLDIVNWEGEQYSRGTILWNTEGEELKLEGIGYLFGDVMGSEDLNEKHDALKVYLRDYGFEHDMYNAGSSPPGSERSILKLENIGCELYIRDVELKGGTDMGFLCTLLPEDVLKDDFTPMSEKRARSIAETSECVENGVLEENAFYNENSKTWWVDLDIDKPGCSPACVIFEGEKVEINWRCTGLIPE